jgi:hypothetical protein
VKRLALLLSLVVLLLLPTPAAADEGWVITSFDASYQIRQDGSVDVIEDIRVDFGTQRHHGILRDIPVEFEYDATTRRGVQVAGVTDGDRDLQPCSHGAAPTSPAHRRPRRRGQRPAALRHQLSGQGHSTRR